MLFLGYGWFGADERSSNTIVIGSGELAWMDSMWQKQWGRPATDAEWNGLVEEYVRETVFYREAMEMGLDKDDTIIRRRMVQKLEFLSQDLVDAIEPSEDELRAYFEENPTKYRQPDLMTFTQVFVDPDLREDQTLPDAEIIKAKLDALGRPSENMGRFGDPFMLQQYYPQRTEAEIAKLFGRGFVENIAGLSTGVWHGPVLSGYGVHLVYVDERIEGMMPEFEVVQDRVLVDFKDGRREEFNEKFYADLRARYDVIIEAESPENDVMASGEEPK